MSRLSKHVRPELIFALTIVATLAAIQYFSVHEPERDLAARSSEPTREAPAAVPRPGSGAGVREPLAPELEVEPGREEPRQPRPEEPADGSKPSAEARLEDSRADEPRAGPASRLDARSQFGIRFTTNQHGRPESSCDRPLCREPRAEIERAQRSIDFAVYGFRAQRQIIDALAAAQRRGVRVRGVVDAEDRACSVFDYADTATLIGLLGSTKVRCDAGPGRGDIMHNKFFVFDRAKVWTGSTNVSDTELGGEYHADVAVLLSSRALAAVYAAELEEMFSGKFHRAKSDDTLHRMRIDRMSVESYFSPSDHAIARAVVPLIAGAKHTLDVAMFFFTSRTIATAIVAAHDRGVAVRMILDAGGAANRASRHHALCASGIEVKVENWGGKSHSKWAVADAAYPAAAVVFGSMNWTESGDERNDENTLYVRSPGFAGPFRKEFERQWRDLASVPACPAHAARQRTSD